MKYWFQVHTGNVCQPSPVNVDLVLQRLEAFADRHQLDGVFAGWGAAPEVYEILVKKLQEWHIPFYFKSAAFSEIGEAPRLLAQWGREAGQLSYEPMMDLHMEEAKPYHLNEEENFLFRCPSSPVNRRIMEEFALAFTDRFSFDGVFLDRIRYNSLISGISGMGCFCPGCRRIYRDKGVDVDHVRQLLLEAEVHERTEVQGAKDVPGDKKILPAIYREGIWIFEDPELNKFFKARSEIIIEAVRSLRERLQARGKKLGLDLFTPSAAYFTGQDVLGLSKEADFIKPMLYQFTDAPAGIPFEMPFVSALTGRYWSVTEVFDADLQLLKKASCSVYPGIEVNVIDPICRVSPRELQETLKKIEQSGFTGIVCSWNMEKMPEENCQVLFTEKTIS